MQYPDLLTTGERVKPAAILLNAYRQRLELAEQKAENSQSESDIANLSNILQETESVTANFKHFAVSMELKSINSAPAYWEQHWQSKSPFDNQQVQSQVLQTSAGYHGDLSGASMILAAECVKRGKTKEDLLTNFPNFGHAKVRSAILLGEIARRDGSFNLSGREYRRAIDSFPFVSICHRRLGEIAWQSNEYTEAKMYSEAACATASILWFIGDQGDQRPIAFSPVPDWISLMFYKGQLYEIPANQDYFATFIYKDEMHIIQKSQFSELWLNYKIPELISSIQSLLFRFQKKSSGNSKASYVPVASNFRFKILCILFKTLQLQKINKFKNLESLQVMLPSLQS